MVRWRLGASGLPPTSSRNASSSRSMICSTPSTRTQAAANSIASGQTEQRLTASELRDEHIKQRSIWSISEPEHGRDGMRYKVWVQERRKGDQPDAIVERTNHARGDAESEPRLTAATDARQRDK